MLLFITAKINSRGKFFMKRIAKTLMLTLSALLVLNFAGCKTEVTPDGSETENGGGGNNGNGSGNGGSSIDKPTAELPANAEVKIVKNEGWLNSAYIIFEQIEGATYTVKCDGKEIDEPLIRYYDEYVWYEPTENAETLQVAWEKKTLKNVVRADALGLAAGSHTMAVCANGTNGSTEYSTAAMTVADNDRQGFAFVDDNGTAVAPGAYKADGTLKDGAIVIYLTEANKKTVKATIGKSEYTGIAEITQAVKTKNTGSTAVDIRIIGKLTLDGLACADMKSAYALGVKEASNVTIEGVGHDATLAAGVAAFTCKSIEICNLGLMKWGGGKDGDGVSLKKSEYVWVHNNDFFYGDAGSDADQVKGDGSMDLKDDSKNVTIAYNHFWDSGKMSLCGMKSESGENWITYHHNWFDHSDSRHPRVRTMTVHVYNNYFDGNAKYGIGVTTGGNIFAEGNFFRNAHDPMMISGQGTDALGSGTFSGETGGQIKAFNNKFEQNNTNGVKFQFRTNKYDYTNNQELGEYKEWTETIGTDNGDGTWTIYDSVVTDSDDAIFKNSLIAIEDASKKGAYYQGSKGKTMFYIDVPANVLKVVLKAKTGSSTSGATTTVSVNGVNSDPIGNVDYVELEFPVSVSKNSTLEIKNSGSKSSLNICDIKVIAASGWETKLTSGADMSQIDAYEVGTRSETIPATVKSKKGEHEYSNFDTVLGDTGLGLSRVPADPDQAKKDVLDYSGRHTPDFAWDFNNAVDDASYAVNTPLNTAIVSHKTSLTKIQNTSSNGTGGDSGSSGDGGSTGGDDSESGSGSGGDITTAVFHNFATDGTTSSYFTISGNLSTGKGSCTYSGITSGTCLKMESSTSIAFSLEKPMKLTLVFGGSTAASDKKVKIDDADYTADANGIVEKELGAGSHTVKKGDSINLFFIALSE